jgi:multidrug efflux pump subunit AcrA (membrane-fusion protein)
MTGGEIALMAVSTALTAAGTVAQASNQAKMARYNAQVAEQNAAAAQRQAEADAARRERQVQQQLAKRRTAYASAGVSIDGSPLDLLEDVAMEGQLDALGIRQRGLAEARQYSIAASSDRFKASTALEEGLLGAGQQIASGASRIAGKYDPGGPPGNDFTGISSLT